MLNQGYNYNYYGYRQTNNLEPSGFDRWQKPGAAFVEDYVSTLQFHFPRCVAVKVRINAAGSSCNPGTAKILGKLNSLYDKQRLIELTTLNMCRPWVSVVDQPRCLAQLSPVAG